MGHLFHSLPSNLTLSCEHTVAEYSLERGKIFRSC
uniref:Uncharacterized protein n=1 Tax=Arundo donax TaxID=35708 RepID=A0A0A8Y5S3_ARUDO